MFEEGRTGRGIMIKQELTLALSIILCISLLTASCTCQTVGNRVEINRYGNVIPAANVTYDLGSITNWWNNGYIDIVLLSHIHYTAKTSVRFNFIGI